MLTSHTLKTEKLNRWNNEVVSMNDISSLTVAYWVPHSSRNTEDKGSNPGTGKYIVAQMTT